GSGGRAVGAVRGRERPRRARRSPRRNTDYANPRTLRRAAGPVNGRRERRRNPSTEPKVSMGADTRWAAVGHEKRGALERSPPYCSARGSLLQFEEGTDVGAIPRLHGHPVALA